MNRKQYNSDTRYEKVLHNMDLLGIMDVTTTRQAKNGTIVWKLPIKNSWKNGKLIEVASFKTGYVRNQNSGYSNYQLNKRCEGKPEYFELPNGDYRRFSTRSCVLIPIEIDRLEYLISYCLKNYYIKRANEVADGKLIPKWEHEYKLEQANSTYSENTGAMERVDDLECRIVDLRSQLNLKCDHYQNLLKEKNDMSFSYEQTLLANKDLENENSCLVEKIEAMTENRDCKSDRVYDLENKLATIIRVARH